MRHAELEEHEAAYRLSLAFARAGVLGLELRRDLLDAFPGVDPSAFSFIAAVAERDAALASASARRAGPGGPPCVGDRRVAADLFAGVRP